MAAINFADLKPSVKGAIALPAGSGVKMNESTAKYVHQDGNGGAGQLLTDLVGLHSENRRIRRFADRIRDGKLLILDLSSSSSLKRPEPRAGIAECALQTGCTIYVAHVPFPSTLVRRPKFELEYLLETCLAEETRVNLLQLIDCCHLILVFDGASTEGYCTSTINHVIEKLKKYIDDDRTVEIAILERAAAQELQSLPCKPISSSLGTSLPNKTHKITTSQKNLPQPGLKLSIEIPKTEPTTFALSLKKNVPHYSPKSVMKYFSFDIPSNIRLNDSCLPIWLKFCTRREDVSNILITLLKNFELLEKLETERLDYCLQPSRGNCSEYDYERDISGLSRVYSLSNLQTQYKKKRKEQRRSKNENLKIDKKPILELSIPSQFDLSKTVNESSSSPPLSTDSENDVLPTPLVDYKMAKGIESYAKNRYSNILPYEHSRVKLQPSPLNGHVSSYINKDTSPDIAYPNEELKSDLSPEENTGSNSESSTITSPTLSSSLQIPSGEMDKFNDYVNASYLRLPQINPDFNYIATQAPLPSTIDDFWKVVLGSDVNVIISINSDDELDLRKWDIYWNENSCSKFDIEVLETFNDVCGLGGCDLRIITVCKYQKSTSKTSHHSRNPAKHTVYHLQYKKWLDSCGIGIHDLLSICQLKNILLADARGFVSYLSKIGPQSENTSEFKSIKEYHDNLMFAGLMKEIRKFRILVHCSAGCGRTGVFITFDFLLNILSPYTNGSNRVDVWNMPQDLIFVVVNELRKQRLSMVQNLTQYITCYESLLKYFAVEKMNTAA